GLNASVLVLRPRDEREVERRGRAYVSDREYLVTTLDVEEARARVARQCIPVLAVDGLVERRVRHRLQHGARLHRCDRAARADIRWNRVQLYGIDAKLRGFITILVGTNVIAFSDRKVGV